MKHIQVISDLHLEARTDNINIPVKSEILFLAGDIGNIQQNNYENFICECSKKWKIIISVLGNNEYYSDQYSMEELLIKYKKLYSKYDNCYLLERNIVMLGSIKIIGCTSWGTFKKKHIGSSPRKIKRRNETGILKPIGIEFLTKKHLDDVKWIMKNIDNYSPTVIITHFPLMLENNKVRQEKHRNEDRSILEEFGRECELHSNNKLVCISGHTHYSHNFNRAGVRYISNQIGKQDEIGTTNFNENCDFNIFDICSI